MRTFLEVIKHREIDKIAYECFVLMGERGVDPMKYVTWLQENDFNQSDLLIESKNWLSIEMEFAEAIDPAVQQNAQKAVASLQDILKRAQRQGSSLGQINGIQNMLADLIYSLQNELEPSTPVASSGMDMDALSKSAATPPAPVTSWNKPEGTVIKESITNLLDDLNEYGIDSKLFAEWYVTKGDTCKTKEEFNEAFGEFLGGIWNGVKSAVGNGWNQFTQGLGQPFNHGMNQYHNQKDVEMVKQAMQILGQLQGQVPHLAQKMQMANKMLGDHAENHARYGSIQPQQGQPQQPQQGQGDPWSAGLAKASSQARKAANPGGFDPQDMRKTMGMAEPTNKTNWYDWNASTGTVLQEHELTDEEFFKSVLGNKKKSTWFN